jgi:uncharacterized membrane protein YqjE
MDTTIKKTPPLPLGNRQGRAIPTPPAGRGSPSTSGLVKEITHEAIELAKKQLELSLTEARADLKAEAKAALGIVVACVSGLFAVALLLATAVLGLSRVMPAWAAGLVVSGVALAATGISGYMAAQRRVREPLEATRRTLRSDLRLLKDGGT